MQTPDSIAHPPVRPAAKWRIVAAGMVILLAGMVIGGVAGFRFARLRDPLIWFNPEAVPGRISKLMKFHLGLTEEQREKIQVIFEEHRAEIDLVRLKMLPDMDRILDDILKETEAVLTPEQAEVWRSKFHELRDKWRPIPAPATGG